ncbi:hypothetical protein ACIBBD_36210 [Streptomyces sp. NPDC051315]|uniref:hypothetical protein n=1 Tax=Streptomyces sp. NPDC051315 TaxID=3365650 RepID=UPI003789C226
MCPSTASRRRHSAAGGNGSPQQELPHDDELLPHDDELPQEDEPLPHEEPFDEPSHDVLVTYQDESPSELSPNLVVDPALPELPATQTPWPRPAP